MVGKHDDGLTVCRNLHRAFDDAVRKDIDAVLGFYRRAAQLGCHAVGIRRDGVERMAEFVQCLFGEHAVLRTGNDAQKRQSGRANVAVGRERGKRPRFKRFETLLHERVLLLRQTEGGQNGQCVACAERTPFHAADMTF